LKYLQNLVFRSFARVYDVYACRRFQLSTFPPVSKPELLKRNGFDDNNGFMAAYLYNVKTIMQKVSDLGGVRDIVDIGSGDGRLLSYICKSHLEVVGKGIEIDSKLFQYSVDFNSGKNCNFVNYNALKFEFIFEDDTVIFIFNSFGERSIEELIRTLIESHRSGTSNIYLAYINHVHKSTLAKLGLNLLRNWENRRMSLWKI
jgi:SAM-dependent methyltransferase